MAANGGSKRYIGLLIILGLALLSWWFSSQERVQEAVKPHEEHVVDYSMSSFEVTAMDDAGKPLHRMQAVSMVHYADDDSADLQKPRLLLYRTPDERWQLDAERAQLYHGGSQMILQGAVEMRRLDQADKVTLTLDTRDLWVYTDPQRAETVEAVEVREQHGVTLAKGMKIDIKDGRIELLAAVRSKYVLEQ